MCHSQNLNAVYIWLEFSLSTKNVVHFLPYSDLDCLEILNKMHSWLLESNSLPVWVIKWLQNSILSIRSGVMPLSDTHAFRFSEMLEIHQVKHFWWSKVHICTFRRRYSLVCFIAYIKPCPELEPRLQMPNSQKHWMLSFWPIKVEINAPGLSYG